MFDFKDVTTKATIYIFDKDESNCDKYAISDSSEDETVQI
jgi:hypothetical protein